MRNIHLSYKENTYQLTILLYMLSGLKIIPTNRPNLMQQISIVPMEVKI